MRQHVLVGRRRLPNRTPAQCRSPTGEHAGASSAAGDADGKAKRP